MLSEEGGWEGEKEEEEDEKNKGGGNFELLFFIVVEFNQLNVQTLESIVKVKFK